MHGTPITALETRPPAADTLPRALWMLVVCAAIVFPWISPYTYGPNAPTVQTLISAVCATVVFVAFQLRGPAIGRDDVTRAIAASWLLAALLSTLVGLLQYFGVNAIRLYPWVTAADVGQAYGNLRQRNQFASLTSLGLVAVLYLATQPAATQRNVVRTLALWAAVLVLATGNAASASRTGTLQWVMIAGLFPVWSLRRSGTVRLHAVTALLVYLAASVLLPPVLSWASGGHAMVPLERFAESSGCGSRLVLWSNVLHLIGERPWLGWGWNGLKFAHFITPYPGERFCELLDNAHNLPLHVAVTWGVPAALLLVFGFGYLVARQKPWREADSARQLAWAAVAVLLLHSMLEYPLWYGPFQIALGLCVVLLWPTGLAPRLPPTAAHTAAVLCVAAIVQAFVAYAAWDYARISQLYLPESLRTPAYRQNTLDKVRNSWIFRDEVQFAEVTTTTITPENAADLYGKALVTLRFSPEPKVVKLVLQSARMAHIESAVTVRLQAQMKAAYPDAP